MRSIDGRDHAGMADANRVDVVTVEIERAPAFVIDQPETFGAG